MGMGMGMNDPGRRAETRGTGTTAAGAAVAAAADAPSDVADAGASGTGTGVAAAPCGSVPPRASAAARGDIRVSDIPPRRTHDFDDLVRAMVAVLVAAVVVASAMFLHGITAGVESDAHNYATAIDWLADVPASMLQQLVTISIVAIALAQLLAARRWLVTASSALALIAGYAAAWGVSAIISGAGNATLVSAMLSATTARGATLLPDMYAGLSAFLTAAGPRRVRSSVKWGWNILYGTAVVMVVLSWHSVPGVLVAFATGRLVGMLIRFGVGTESTGTWGPELVTALEGIGLEPASLARRGGMSAPAGGTAAASKTAGIAAKAKAATDGPSSGRRLPLGQRIRPERPMQAMLAVPDDDLVEGSRLYDLTCRDGSRYVVSVLDGQRHSAGYLRQMWQWIRFTGVSVRRDRSTRDATQHHLSMLLGLANIGLPAAHAYGMADTGDSSILVLDATARPTPATGPGTDAPSDDDLAAWMRYLDRAHRHGYTHRHITPDTLVRLAGHDTPPIPVIAGWHNGDEASSAANIALDKVQLLALAGALAGPERAVAAARQAWGDHDTAALVPFMQKVAVPAATRALGTWDKGLLDDLRHRLNALTPEDAADTAEPVTLARFSLKSFLMLVLLVVALAVVVTQLKPDEVIAAVRNAQPSMALVCLLLSLLSWAGAAVSFGAFIDAERRDPLGVMMSQVANGFASVSMPAGIGPTVINLQFLRRAGYRSTPATAIVSAVLVVYYAVYTLMLLVIGLFTGRSMFTGMIPTNTLIIVLGTLAGVVSVAMMIPPVRRFLAARLVPLVKAYTSQLWDVLSRPGALAVSCLGALAQNIAMALCFWVALLAFGHHANPVETVFVFLLANALGSAVPTPGGLGGVEAALTLSFSAVGVPQGVALSATLLYRVAFYWLRIPAGALATRWLTRRGMI